MTICSVLDKQGQTTTSNTPEVVAEVQKEATKAPEAAIKTPGCIISSNQNSHSYTRQQDASTPSGIQN
ncbi:hypothetical protein TanjilG_32703 [Lupinus angustifolius]|uniref:Uncharacterized protein n=1 Tax=Lupinus angustifolius TaxID=3871 RepID=A0A1J7G0E9_LUPAN|nr:hypothetical protein TanjilG_05588 [Lupinus angustifolius]OIW07847.1 hypothetical protein TanjilG_32703 [Lupinus angustifolius]